MQQSSLLLADPFDPTTWKNEEHEFRIYSGRSESIYAVVDEVDYHDAIKHCWTHKVSRGGKKIYLKRCVETQIGQTEYSDERMPDGRRKRIYRARIQNSVYLHRWIMQRTGKKPPTKKHVLVDHEDGDERNCRRNNLRWATHQMNRMTARR